MAGAAILAYIKAMKEKTFDDEDEEVYWANNYTLLWTGLKLDSFPPLDEANQE